MPAYDHWEIQEIPLTSSLFRRKVEAFLEAAGLRLDALDAYFAIETPDGDILAGGGYQKNIIKCIAVSEQSRSEGLAVPLISRLIAEVSARGYDQILVFTKPENRAIFESLGFHPLAAAPKAILLENGKGLEHYCRFLADSRRPGKTGVIVMNANPFTLGHRYLVEKALEQVERLYIIPVREDVSVFPYLERKAMISAGVASWGDRVVVLEGSDYLISAATFPTYFLKDLSDAAETQMRLDIDLFASHIAPALGNPLRFVGSEPSDPLTARYNALLLDLLPGGVVEIPRLCETPDQVGGDGTGLAWGIGTGPAWGEGNVLAWGDGTGPAWGDGTGATGSAVVMPGNDRASRPVSASAVRAALDAGSFQTAAALTPASTHPYLLAALAERALRLELDAPQKPGLVCPDSPGAHCDMDYTLMQKGIAAIRPYFAPMAQAPNPQALRQLGIEAEKAMLAATGGVNTHRGAIFALGLALHASCGGHYSDNKEIMRNLLCRTAEEIFGNTLIDSDIAAAANGAVPDRSQIKGAREMALDGYRELFEDWLPYYRAHKDRPDALQCTLLRIMSTLDDTCVIKRVGYDRAQQVKAEALALLSGSEADRKGVPSRDVSTPGHGQGDGARWRQVPEGDAGNNGRGRSEQSERSSRDGIPSGAELPTAALQDLCTRYAAEGISPGGAADMLALTIFIDSITS